MKIHPVQWPIGSTRWYRGSLHAAPTATSHPAANRILDRRWLPPEPEADRVRSSWPTTTRCRQPPSQVSQPTLQRVERKAVSARRSRMDRLEIALSERQSAVGSHVNEWMRNGWLATGGIGTPQNSILPDSPNWAYQTVIWIVTAVRHTTTRCSQRPLGTVGAVHYRRATIQRDGQDQSL